MKGKGSAVLGEKETRLPQAESMHAYVGGQSRKLQIIFPKQPLIMVFPPNVNMVERGDRQQAYVKGAWKSWERVRNKWAHLQVGGGTWRKPWNKALPKVGSLGMEPHICLWATRGALSLRILPCCSSYYLGRCNWKSLQRKSAKVVAFAVVMDNWNYVGGVQKTYVFSKLLTPPRIFLWQIIVITTFNTYLGFTVASS